MILRREVNVVTLPGVTQVTTLTTLTAVDEHQITENQVFPPAVTTVTQTSH